MSLGVGPLLVLCNRRSKLIPPVGSDTVPIVVPFREFGDELHISLPSFPQLPPVKSASIGRYLLCWWDREVHIWLVKKSSKDFQDEADDPKATKQVARLEVQVRE